MQRLRLARGWTRSQVALAARITPTTYGSVERGRHTQTSVLTAIAAVFGVPVEDVLVAPPVNPAALISASEFEATVGPLAALIERARGSLPPSRPISPEVQAAAATARRTIARAQRRAGRRRA